LRQFQQRGHHSTGAGLCRAERASWTERAKQGGEDDDQDKKRDDVLEERGQRITDEQPEVV
jgi:hypothetical protein